MRALLALGAAGLLALPPVPAPAQSAQETARGAAPASGPGAALQSYALQLQLAETRLAKAREVTATDSRTGAASQERSELMQGLRAAWSDMRKVPATFSESVAYQQAQRSMQHDLADVGPDRSPSKEKADAAVQDALQVLSELRGHVVSAAGHAGAGMPAPEGGGANR